MYLRTVLRSRDSCRAIAETDSPCRCKSKIITSSPSRITAPPLPPIGRDHPGVGDRAPPGLPGRAPEDPASHLGNFQTALLGRITPPLTDVTDLPGNTPMVPGSGCPPPKSAPSPR